MAVTYQLSGNRVVGNVYSKFGGAITSLTGASGGTLITAGQQIAIGDVIFAAHAQQYPTNKIRALDLSGLSAVLALSGGTITTEWRYPSAMCVDLDTAAMSAYTVTTDNVGQLAVASTVEFDDAELATNYLNRVNNDNHYQYLTALVVTGITGTPVADNDVIINANGVAEYASAWVIDSASGDVITMDDLVANIPDVVASGHRHWEINRGIQFTGDGEWRVDSGLVLFKRASRERCASGVAANFGSVAPVRFIYSGPEATSYHGQTSPIKGDYYNVEYYYLTRQGSFDLPFTSSDVILHKLGLINYRSDSSPLGSVLSNLSSSGGHVQPARDTLYRLNFNGIICRHVIRSNTTGAGEDITYYQLSSPTLVEFYQPGGAARGWDVWTGEQRIIDPIQYTVPFSTFSEPLAGLTGYIARSVISQLTTPASDVLCRVGVNDCVAADGDILALGVYTVDTVSGIDVTWIEDGAADALHMAAIVVLDGAAAGEYRVLTRSGLRMDSGAAGLAPGDRVASVPYVDRERWVSDAVGVFAKTELTGNKILLRAYGYASVMIPVDVDEQYRLPVALDTPAGTVAADSAAALAVAGITVDDTVSPVKVSVDANTNPNITIQDLFDFLNAWESADLSRPVITTPRVGGAFSLEIDLELDGPDSVALGGTANQSLVITGSYTQLSSTARSAIPITDSIGTTSILRVTNITVATEILIFINGELTINESILADKIYQLPASANGAVVAGYVSPEGKQSIRFSGSADGTVREIAALDVAGLDKQSVADALLLAPTTGVSVAEGSMADITSQALTTDEAARLIP